MRNYQYFGYIYIAMKSHIQVREVLLLNQFETDMYTFSS